MSGYEYDRRMIAFGDLALQVEAVDIRQSDIEQEAGWQVRLDRTDKLMSRLKGDRTHAMRCQEFVQRLPQACVVVDDVDNGIICRHCAAFASIGSEKMSFAPQGPFFSARKGIKSCRHRLLQRNNETPEGRSLRGVAPVLNIGLSGLAN